MTIIQWFSNDRKWPRNDPGHLVIEFANDSWPNNLIIWGHLRSFGNVEMLIYILNCSLKKKSRIIIFFSSSWFSFIHGFSWCLFILFWLYCFQSISFWTNYILIGWVKSGIIFMNFSCWSHQITQKQTALFQIKQNYVEII